ARSAAGTSTTTRSGRRSGRALAKRSALPGWIRTPTWRTPTISIRSASGSPCSPTQHYPTNQARSHYDEPGDHEEDAGARARAPSQGGVHELPGGGRGVLREGGRVDDVLCVRFVRAR